MCSTSRTVYDRPFCLVTRPDLCLQGGRILCGGEQVALSGDLSGGCYLQPCIVDCPSDELELAREEVFGAVLALLEFSTEEEVVRRANATRYGLSAGLFTR